ncbi:MAG: metallophosphoesterase [Acidobacteriota bacterium]
MSSAARAAGRLHLREGACTLGLAAAALAWVCVPPRVMIEGPAFGGPRIVTPGESIEITARVAIPWVMAVDGATLVRGEGRLPLPLSESPGAGPRQTARVHVPPDCAPGLYDLEVRAGAASARVRRAVAVLASMPERFTIAQISDLHIGFTAASERSVAAIIDEINSLHPALVVVSGDIAHQGRWEEYARAEKLLERLEAPIVSVPGNHDRRGWAGYLSTFGFPYHAVTFGSWTILGLDAAHGRDQFTLSQTTFLAGALAAVDGRRVVAVSHIPLAGRRSVQARASLVADLLEAHGVPLVVSGHWHYPTAYDGTARGGTGSGAATRYVVTTTAGGNLRRGIDGRLSVHGYQVISVEDGRVTATTAQRLADHGTSPGNDAAVGRGGSP